MVNVHAVIEISYYLNYISLYTILGLLMDDTDGNSKAVLMKIGQHNTNTYNVVMVKNSQRTIYISISVNLDGHLSNTKGNSNKDLPVHSCCSLNMSHTKVLFSSVISATIPIKHCCTYYHDSRTTAENIFGNHTTNYCNSQSIFRLFYFYNSIQVKKNTALLYKRAPGN